MDTPRQPSLQDALDALPFSFAAFAEHGRLILCNEAMRQHLGLARAEAEALDWTAFLRRLAFRGLLGDGAPEERAAEFLPFGGSPATGARLLRTAEGRALDWFHASMAGGWVAGLAEAGPRAAALQAAEAASRQASEVIAQLQTGLARFDSNGRLRRANPRYADLLGLPEGTPLEGVTLSDLLDIQIGAGEIPAEVKPAIEADFAERLSRARGSWHVERTKPDGRTIRFVNHPMPDGGWLAEVTDISEARNAEREARRRAAMHDALIEALPVGVAVYGPDRRVSLVNQAYNRILADDPIRIGENLRDIVERRARRGEFGQTDPEAAVERVLSRLDQPQGFERRRPGGGVAVHRSVPLPDGGHAMVVSDITDLQAAREEAKESASVLDTMLESTRHGIVLFDAEGKVVAANRLAAPLAGVSPDAFAPGTSIYQLREEQARRGVFGDKAETQAFLEWRGHQPLRAQDAYRRAGPSNTVIEVVTDALPDGGFVRSYTDVTALVRAEREAQARAQTLQRVLDTVRHGIIMYDAENKVVAGNGLAERLFGLPEGAVHPGITYDELRAIQVARGEHGEPESAARAMAARPALTDGESTYQRRRPDGTVVEIRTEYLPEGGCVRSVTDITALAAAQAESANRAAMLQVMLDNMRHGIMLFDAEERVVAFNRLAAELTGMGEALVVGATMAELRAAQAAAGEFGDAEGTARYVAELEGRDNRQPAQRRRRRPNGMELEATFSPVPGGGYVLTVTDVTGRVRAEEEAKQRAARMEATLNATRHSLTLYGPDHRLVSANGIAGSLVVGGDPRPLIGLTLREVMRIQLEREFPNQPEEVERELSRIMALDRSQPQRYQRRRPDGRVLDITSDPTKDGGFAVAVADVTALVRAEEEAKRRSEFLQAMVNNSRQGVLLYNKDRVLVAANRLAGELLNMPGIENRAGATGSQIMSELGPAGYYGEPGTAEAEAVETQLRGLDRSIPHRFTRALADGRVLDISSDPTPDGGIVISASDVTPLVQAEEKAQRRAQTLSAMLGNSQQGVLLYDRNGRLLQANSLAAELFSLPGLEGRIGATLEELVLEQARAGQFGVPGDPETEAQIAAVLSTDRSRSQRSTRRTADGRVMAIASDPLPDGGFVVSVSEITALVRAEEEAQRRADLLTAMLGNIRHGLAMFDRNGAIVASNSILHEMLHISAEVVAPGRTLDDMVNALRDAGEYGEGPEGAAMAEQIKRRDRSVSIRSTRQRADGTAVEVVSDPTPDGGWVVTYTDVSEDRRIRAELERAREAAEAANLAKSRFLATMSHELRTPLNAVIGFSEVLAAGADARLVPEYAGAIQEAGRHLLTLIDDILDITRAEEGRLPVAKERVDLGPLLRSACRMMSGQAEAAQLSLEVMDAPEDLPALTADTRRLRQVLLNLMSNAVKFTPAGGTVTLSAAREEGALVIDLRDTGIGIAESDMGRLFQPFAQVESSASRRYAGSGLGLYLCRVLVEAQGGTLTLESEMGKGTLARLRFPPHLLEA
ncbi:PAS-domain containing protein [Sabulicella glaciei]|uniref:histidine kinase n=1 Tax=Sabulicella glaciei TaxID=2984948 RepID=A0ABT3NVX0_9PROT|nr:PAS-domain containing protein [Roseococcus sp. MDT2-1-1]MCW8086033.1 PAS-domain containing protein [Roseococcus sp. MDT2-1-1]